MSQQQIKQLLERCKRQDKAAQFEVYKLYYKAMFNTALRILQDSFEAEDAMQEAFLSAFTKLESYKGEVAFGAWLKRIVINKSLTLLKKNKRVEEVKLEVVADNTVEDDLGLDPGSLPQLQVQEVLDTMAKLKENYRMVLQLNLIEGYDHEEIAEIMNISNQNCRTTLSRAKQKLRSLIKQAV